MEEATSRELRFEPSGSLIGLLLFLPTYGLGGGLATWMTYRQLMTSASSQALGLAQAALLIVLYFIGAYLLLLYFVLGPQRFRFYDSFFIGLATKRHLHFMAKTELFEGKKTARLLSGPISPGTIAAGTAPGRTAAVRACAACSVAMSWWKPK